MKAMNGFIPSPEPTEFVELPESNASSWDWRTKGNADHAGLSPPLVPWKVQLRSRATDFIHFQSKILLIAIRRVMDAKVDSWMVLSNMLRLTHLCPSTTTHTLPETETASMTNQRE